jgi:hypothetical protein
VGGRDGKADFEGVDAGQTFWATRTKWPIGLAMG